MVRQGEGGGKGEEIGGRRVRRERMEGKGERGWKGKEREDGRENRPKGRCEGK